jgi:hypothetical protein
MRIATWNLERPRRGSVRKLPGLRAQLAAIKADIWVLTETNDQAVDLSPTHPYWVSTIPVVGLHSPGERWTTMWSRHPTEPLATYDPHLAACGRVATRLGTLLVYGTVLPYHADPRANGTAKTWMEFYRVVPLQGNDWTRLQEDYPGDRFCVAGDLNQGLDGRRWAYGKHELRKDLLNALDDADLNCVTKYPLVAAGHLTTRSSVDHICMCAASLAKGWLVGAWEAPDGMDGKPITDHNGVYVDLPSEAA